jgi:hypothetical protein
MAVAFQSIATKTVQTNVSSIVIDKPTGLAEGDLMIAVLFGRDTAGGRTFDVVSGWTDCGDGQQNTTVSGVDRICERALYKFASAADAAASNFTFTITGGNIAYVQGGLYRISGANTVQPIDAHGTGSLAQTYTNGLILILPGARTSGVSVTFSGYAVTTDDPGGWVEDFDMNLASGIGSSAGAHVIRPAVTNTGGYSVTIEGGGSPVSLGIVLIIRDIVSVTVTPSVISLVASIIAPVITTGVNVVATVVSLTMNLITPTVTKITTWANQTKNSAGWTNEDKN